MPDDGRPFPTIDAAEAARKLPELLRGVACRTGRVQIRGGDACDCVLISKAELDGLERALEILCRTEQVHRLEEGVARLLASDMVAASA